MAKVANQKLKLVYLRQILLERTDEQNLMSLHQIIAALNEMGVEVHDRKSIYDDLEALRVSGLDIEGRRDGKGYGYFVATRPFELAELKLLVDAVQSSKFITHKKTAQLIKKVESLTSVHQARQLQRQVFVAGRIKNMNESIYYNVDAVSQAISASKAVSFRYFEWVLGQGREKVEKSLRRQGHTYEISPWSLCWAEENYYLVGFDPKAQMIKHFRVDKMQDIEIIKKPKRHVPPAQDFDAAEYSRKMFGMFGGEEERVRIRFANRLIGVVADRFGRDIMLVQDGDGHFIAAVEVAVSPQFLSWIIGFGAEARVISPNNVAENVRQLALAAIGDG